VSSAAGVAGASSQPALSFPRPLWRGRVAHQEGPKDLTRLSSARVGGEEKRVWVFRKGGKRETKPVPTSSFRPKRRPPPRERQAPDTRTHTHTQKHTHDFTKVKVRASRKGRMRARAAEFLRPQPKKPNRGVLSPPRVLVRHPTRPQTPIQTTPDTPFDQTAPGTCERAGRRGADTGMRAREKKGGACQKYRELAAPEPLPFTRRRWQSGRREAEKASLLLLQAR
jgi:hypothetical protein